MPERTASASEDFYRPQEASLLLGVSMKTLTRWSERGLIRAVTLPSGHRRYRKADIDPIAEQMNGEVA